MLAQRLGFTGLTMDEILDIDLGRIVRAVEAVNLADDLEIVEKLFSDDRAIAAAAHKKYTKVEKDRARATHRKVERLLEENG